MSFLPMTVERCHESLIDCFMIEGEFTENFGPWTEGHKTTIVWDFEAGNAKELNDEGEVINSTDISLAIA